jgi:hypothetical protein
VRGSAGDLCHTDWLQISALISRSLIMLAGVSRKHDGGSSSRACWSGAIAAADCTVEEGGGRRFEVQQVHKLRR